MSLDFRHLVRDAGWRPPVDTSLRGLCTWMSEVVYQIKNFSSKYLSYHASDVALGYIAKEREVVIFRRRNFYELQNRNTGV